MSAANHRRPVGEIVNVIMALITDLRIDENTPVFDRVELFDSEDLVAAFQFLLITEQRVCVVVPLTEDFRNLLEGLKLTVTRRLPIAILCSDKVLGSRKAALWGDETTLGSMALAEKVLPLVTGLLIANPKGVVCEPQRMTILTVKDTEKQLPSRVTVALEVECHGGWLEAQLGRSPVA